MKIPGIPFPVHVSNGRYYRVVGNRWVPLSRVSDGLAALEERCRNIDSGPQTGSMPAAIDEYLAQHLPTLTPAVRKEHERMFRKVAEAFADFSVSQVRPRHCLGFLGYFTDKPTARQSYKYRLSAFFSWCVVQELTEANPLREVKITGPVKHRTCWTDDLFLDVAGHLSEMMLCYHWLSYHLFQRATDIRLLERAGTERDIIRIRPSKTARSSGGAVDLAVTPSVREWLDRAAAESRRMKVICPYVIHTSAGTPYTRSGVYSQYRRADIELHQKATGLNPKDIRSYAATRYDKLFGDRKALQERLVHTKSGTTEGYIHQHTVPVSMIDLPPPVKS